MKILVIQLKQIGDVLLTTPMVRCLADGCPEASIDFLAQQPAAQVYSHSPFIHKLWVMPPSQDFWGNLAVLRKLRKEKFDLVIDAMGTPRTAILTMLTGAKKSIGFNFRGRGRFYTQPVSAIHDLNYSATHKISLLQPLGLASSNVKLQFQDRPVIDSRVNIRTPSSISAAQPLRISVAPVSRRIYKEWPAMSFVEALRLIAPKGLFQFTLIGGPGEESKLRYIKHKLADYHIKVEVENFQRLSDIWRHYETADLYLGNDSGLHHFAVAQKIPTYTILGKTFAGCCIPAEPAGQPKLHHWIENSVACKQACTFPRCKLECLATPPSAVAEGFIELVQQKFPSARLPT